MPPWLLKLQLEACGRYVQIRPQRLCPHGHLKLELEACGCYGKIWLQSLQSWPFELGACDCHGQIWFRSSQPWPLELEAWSYSLLTSKLYGRHGQIKLQSSRPWPLELVPFDRHGRIGFKVHSSGYSSSSLKRAAAMASRACSLWPPKSEWPWPIRSKGRRSRAHDHHGNSSFQATAKAVKGSHKWVFTSWNSGFWRFRRRRRRKSSRQRVNVWKKNRCQKMFNWINATSTKSVFFQVGNIERF